MPAKRKSAERQSAEHKSGNARMARMAGIPAKPGSGNDHVLKLQDGRRLGYRTYGADAGPVLIALHGTPGSRLKFSAADAAAKALGMRLVAPDRWGYGLSDAPEKPSLAAYADDLEQLADALQLDRFAVMGVSGGGPYAAASAARLGARVEALALVSPVGQIAESLVAQGQSVARGHSGAAELSHFHRFCFQKLPHMPAVIDGIFRLFRLGLRYSPDATMKFSVLRAAGADRKVMALASVRRRLAATFIEGLRPGALGPVIDLKLFGGRWDVPLDGVSARAQLWIGSEDNNVPLAPALALGRQLPGCDVTQLPGEGHLWVALHYGDVLGWIAEARMAPRQ